MTFRPALVSDAPFIVSLVTEFYERSLKGFGIEYNSDSTLSTVLRVIRTGTCLVGPTSCAGATLGRFPWNESAIVASVQFWTFNKRREIAIFEALIDRCRRAGATHLTASSHFPGNAIGRLYERLGLKPAEIVSLIAL